MRINEERKIRKKLKIAKDYLNCKKRSQVQLYALLLRATRRKGATELSQSNF